MSRFDAAHSLSVGAPPILVATLLLALAAPPPARAQDNDAVRQGLFGELEANLAQAAVDNFSFLSPKHYEGAQKSHREAVENFERGRSLDQIEENIAESQAHLDQASEIAEVSRTVLEGPMELRAAIAETGLVSNPRFASANSKLIDAGREAEGGSLPSARDKAVDASRAYRKGTLEYLRNDSWKSAEAMLKAREGFVDDGVYKPAETELKSIRDRLKDMNDRESFSVGELLATTRGQLDDVLAKVGAR